MTVPTITCERFADHLADYLESDADAATRAALEAHAARCTGCGALLTDLRRLRSDAAALPPLAPERDLWAGIAARIETPVVEITPGGQAAPWAARRARTMNVAWMGIAAAALIAVTATITRRVSMKPAASGPVNVAMVAKPGPSPAVAHATDSEPTNAAVPAASTRESIAAPAPATTRLAANKLTAEQAYDAEIAGLRAIVAQRRSSLDTATINVIERNLKVIDDAIAQCRAALRKDPASRFLIESLNDALDTKIQLLRTAATLPTRA